MINNINKIIEKYWAGASTLEEEALLQSYLLSEEVDTEHKDLIPLFEYFEESRQHNFQGSLEAGTLLYKAFTGIDNLIDKYWEGRTTLGEEERLKAYFSSDEVSKDHRDLIPLFRFFKEQEAMMPHKELDMSFVEDQNRIQEVKPVEKTKLRKLYPRITTIAASVVLMLAVSFAYFNGATHMEEHLVEAIETEEALAVTKEALAFLGHNYERGSDPMKHMKQLEKTDIFKFN